MNDEAGGLTKGETLLRTTSDRKDKLGDRRRAEGVLRIEEGSQASHGADVHLKTVWNAKHCIAYLTITFDRSDMCAQEFCDITPYFQI